METTQKRVRVLVDAMGGDNAPLEILKGAVLAKNEFEKKADIALVGQPERIREVAEKEGLDLSGIQVYAASEVIAMDDPPLSVRQKKDSSLRVGCNLLSSGEVDAFVSAGSTGALHTGATLFVKRIPGIHRAAIGSILPLKNPVLLMDSGANTSVTAEYLLQFAVMGSAYMKTVFGIESPRVGLLNIGEEDIKGTDLQREAFALLKQAKGLHFVGNVEAKAVPFDVCDVLVTDGFTGNVLLKSVEGMASFFSGEIKGIFLKNIFTKLASPVYLKPLKSLRRRFDVAEYGGAPILGVSKPVVKAHGSSTARYIRSTVKQAIDMASSGMIGEIRQCCGEYEKILSEGKAANTDRSSDETRNG